MGIDVIDIGRRQTGALQRHGHAAEGAVAILGWGGNVEGIAGQAVTDHFGIDLGAARLGVLEFLEHNDPCTLAHDETVSILVIGTRGRLRIVVARRRQSLAGGKAGERNAADRRFRAAGHHYVGIAESDQPRRIADGMGAGGAGRNDRMIGTAQLVADRHLAGGEVDQAAWNEEWRQAPRTLVAQDVAGFNDAFDAADAGTDQNASRTLVVIGLRMPVGILKRHVGGSDRIDDEVIDLALLLVLHPVVRIEGTLGIAGGDAAGHLGRQIIDFEFSYEAGTTFAGEKFRPGQFSSTP